MSRCTSAAVLALIGWASLAVCCTELFHDFSLDYFNGCIAHKTGRLVHRRESARERRQRSTTTHCSRPFFIQCHVSGKLVELGLQVQMKCCRVVRDMHNLEHVRQATQMWTCILLWGARTEVFVVWGRDGRVARTLRPRKAAEAAGLMVTSVDAASFPRSTAS